MVEDPDAGLVALTGQGDAEAASRLVARHLPRMTALARRMLGDSAEAEDVAQDVFLKVWTQAKRWKPGAAKFDPETDRIMMCGSMEMIKDFAAFFEANGFTEGSNAAPGQFVIERAFVG